jgi:tetratricopeptide (TPR) repeat protein
VRADVRHQLKQDRFREATIEQVHWAVEHRNALILWGIVVLAAIAIGFGSWAYINHRDELASVELNKAARTYETPISPVATPGYPSFTSVAERAKKAHAEFQAVADQYRHTRNGEVALYLAGLTAIEAGDSKTGEQELKETADHSNNDLAAPAKMALAALYRNSNRDAQALELYKQVVDKPSTTVAKQSAQFELAALYVLRKQPQEARRLYEQIQKENPNSEYSGLAASKLAELPKQ